MQAERQSSNAGASTSQPPSAAAAASGATAASAAAAALAERRLQDRMRNWSGRLGGQITTLVDNLKKTHLDPATQLPTSPSGGQQSLLPRWQCNRVEARCMNDAAVLIGSVGLHASALQAAAAAAAAAAYEAVHVGLASILLCSPC